MDRNAWASLDRFIASISELDAFSFWEKEYFKLHRQRYQVCIDNVKKYSAGKMLLEIGSVPCHLTVLLAASGFNVTGVDPHPERSQKLIRNFSLDVIKRDIEVEELPFKDNSFGTIVFSEVIEHMYVNPLHALREIARVLRPHGRILLFTDNLYSLHTLKNFIIGNSINDAVEEWRKLEDLGHRGHIRLYSQAEVCALLSLVGLRPIHKEFYNYNEWRSAKSALIYRMTPCRFWPNQLVVGVK